MRSLCILVFVLAVVLTCEGAYRGGSSYRGSSSYRSYSSSYRSGYSYRSYSGSYSYRGNVRYSRYSYGGFYSYYYSMYYYMYVSNSYRVSGNTYNSGASGNICKNYEANHNGTVLGVFKCPLSFEPSTHIYCCGDTELEYCCKLADSSVLYGIIFGTLFGVGIVILIIVCSVKCYTSKRGKTGEENEPQQNQQRYAPPPNRNVNRTVGLRPAGYPQPQQQPQHQHPYNTRYGSNYPPPPGGQNNYSQHQQQPLPGGQNNYGQQQQPLANDTYGWASGPPPPPVYM